MNIHINKKEKLDLNVLVKLILGQNQLNYSSFFSKYLKLPKSLLNFSCSSFVKKLYSFSKSSFCLYLWSVVSAKYKEKYAGTISNFKCKGRISKIDLFFSSLSFLKIIFFKLSGVSS